MNVSHSLFALALLGAGACTAAESQGSGLKLEAKLPTTFAQVSNVVELADGRVMFADTREKLFLSADLRSGEIDTLGTRVDSLVPGAPAIAYKFPGWVARVGGDTVALVDFSGLRTTLWNDRGEPLGVLPLKPVAGNAPVLVYDTVGHGYKVDYQAILGGGEPGRALRPDSIPVLRIELKSGSADTVAFLAAPEYGDAVFGEQVQEVAKVFGPNDYFGVLPDGTTWVARGREVRVDWRSPDGRWVRGQPHAFRKIAVTQEDRDRVLARVREHGKQFGMPQDLPIKYPFAATKPPFELAVSRPTGEVWLQQPRAGGDDPVRYAVYNRQGAFEREVEFPEGAVLAGFGKDGAIYAALEEDDGRTIARYRVR